MLDFNRTPARFFPPDPRRETRSLQGALHFHAAAVESCLVEAGQRPGIAYSAVDVVRIAATLLAASFDTNGEPRWPESDFEEELDESNRVDPDDLPF
jgi:hypothetical protein